MRIRYLAVALLCLCGLPLCARGAGFDQRWVYVSTNLAVEDNVTQTIDLFRRAKADGCTHVLLSDYKFGLLGEQPPEYFKNLTRVCEAAKESGLTVIPEIYPIGYSSSFLHIDPNLAAGLPVKDAPFVVKGTEALPDPAAGPALANPGFEDAKDNTLSGWTLQDFAGERTFVDKEVRHSSAASLKMTNLSTIPKEFAGHCRVMQVLKTKPFQYYRLSVWVKTDGLKADQAQLLLLSSGEKRTHSYKKLGIKPTQDWTKHEIVFNSLEAEEIQLYVGLWEAKEGTIWWDDLEIAPAGLLHVLRADLTPVKVTSADGAVVYEEGKDFARIEDPLLGKNDYAPDHAGPAVKLTPASRIKDGGKLLVSFYHPIVIHDDQVTCSVTNPKVFTLMQDQMRRIVDATHAQGYFMSYDEIRVGGWEPEPVGAHHTPGELLARHVAKGVEIAKKLAPKATLYVWSDMFDPSHNAHTFSKGGYYYLVNGTWDGSWEGLPASVIVCTWIPQAESLIWFAGRGSKQIMAGYYDGPVKANIASWMKASSGVPDIVGMMYTTWEHNYKDMDEFFTLLKEYPNRGK